MGGPAGDEGVVVHEDGRTIFVTEPAKGGHVAENRVTPEPGLQFEDEDSDLSSDDSLLELAWRMASARWVPVPGVFVHPVYRVELHMAREPVRIQRTLPDGQVAHEPFTLSNGASLYAAVIPRIVRRHLLKRRCIAARVRTLRWTMMRNQYPCMLLTAAVMQIQRFTRGWLVRRQVRAVWLAEGVYSP